MRINSFYITKINIFKKWSNELIEYLFLGTIYGYADQQPRSAFKFEFANFNAREFNFKLQLLENITNTRNSCFLANSRRCQCWRVLERVFFRCFPIDTFIYKVHQYKYSPLRCFEYFSPSKMVILEKKCFCEII